MTLMSSLRKTSSKAAVNLLSRSWMRNRIRSNTPVKLRLRACWVTQAPLGLVVQPANWTRRRLPGSMKNNTGSRVRGCDLEARFHRDGAICEESYGVAPCDGIDTGVGVRCRKGGELARHARPRSPEPRDSSSRPR